MNYSIFLADIQSLVCFYLFDLQVSFLHKLSNKIFLNLDVNELLIFQDELIVNHCQINHVNLSVVRCHTTSVLIDEIAHLLLYN